MRAQWGMPITFKSKATGDLLMLAAHAEQVLSLLDKSARQPGILQPQQMPHALQTLRSLPELPLEEEDALSEASTPVTPSVPMSDGISLRKRAWPLVRMIEEAQAANESIVWGV